MASPSDEIRRLIDIIEANAKSENLEKLADDFKIFANTTSFLANTLEQRLKNHAPKSTRRSKPPSFLPPLPAPAAPKKMPNKDKREPLNTPKAIHSKTQNDYDKLQAKGAAKPISYNTNSVANDNI